MPNDKDNASISHSTSSKTSQQSHGMDPSSPYFVHPSDHPNHMLVPMKLNGANYPSGTKSMIHALTAKNKIGFINVSIKPPSESEQPTKYAQWNQYNSMVLSWLTHSVEPDLAKGVVHTKIAHQVWDDLRDQFLQKNAPAIYQIKKSLASLSQGTMTTSAYFTKLKGLWDELDTAILVSLPLRDAVRTSILSNKWRYNWRRLPELTLDEALWDTRDKSVAHTIMFTEIFYHLLTLHVGPITKLTLSIANLGDCPKIDNLIYFLSRNSIEHLVLQLLKNYKLPSSLFKCLKLRHLRLHNCSFHPPSSFRGFNELVSLELYKVKISSELLESLISRSPLLEKLVLRISSILSCTQINAPKLISFDFEGRLEFISLKKAPLVKLSIVDTGGYVNAGNPDLAKCLESFTAFEHLHLNYCSVQFLVEGSGRIPAKLSPPLNCLKRLRLSNICLDELFELKCALCWIRSSPHIEDIQIETEYESISPNPVRGDAVDDIPASFSCDVESPQGC